MHELIKASLRMALPVTCLSLSVLAQAGGQQPVSTKGAVIKGKAPVNKEILKVKLPKPTETKLSNGLQVLVMEDHKLPTFTMQLVIKSGGLHDAPNALGAAQWTATLLREGTTTRDSKKISEEIETLGASLSAGASLTSQSTTVSASGLVENFDQILALFADVLLHPSFPADEMAKLKSRQIASIRMQRAQAGFLASEKFRNVLYGNHPGGRYALTAEQIQALTPETLKAFHAQHFRPNNAIFAITGDVKPAAIVAKLEKALAEWKAGEASSLDLPAIAALPATKIHLIDRPGSVQTNFILGLPTITLTDPDYFPLEMLNQVVGGNASARLFLNLREDKGYTYGAYSSTSAYKYRGTFNANSEVRTEVTGGALKEFMYELKRIRDEQVPAEELDRAKRTIVGGWALQLESPASILDDVVTGKLYNLPADYWDTYPQKIAAVTATDIQRVAQKYIDLSKLQIVAVGDAAKIIDVLKEYGTVEATDANGKPWAPPSKVAAPASEAPAAPPAANAAAVNVTGNWTLTVDSPQGPLPLKVEMKQTGNKLAGTLDTPFGKFPFNDGTISGNEVTFKAKLEVQGNAIELTAKGKLDGDTLKGELSSDMGAMPFNGKKEK